jgi:hypothetical protein
MAKVITLLQPWAQLVVLGFKQFETRTRRTEFRGEIFIHSSARMYAGDLELCQVEPHFKKCIPDPHVLQMGKIIGKAVIEACYPAEEIADFLQKEAAKGSEIAARELKFGDFRKGRFAYSMTHAVLFQNPIFARGNVMIWDYPHPDIDDLIPVSSAPAYPGDQAPTMGQSY